MSESFWHKNSLVTHIFLDLCLLKNFNPVANFGQQSLCNFAIFRLRSCGHPLMPVILVIVLSLSFSLSFCTKYSCVHFSLDDIFSKILKKPFLFYRVILEVL